MIRSDYGKEGQSPVVVRSREGKRRIVRTFTFAPSVKPTIVSASLLILSAISAKLFFAPNVFDSWLDMTLTVLLVTKVTFSYVPFWSNPPDVAHINSTRVTC